MKMFTNTDKPAVLYLTTEIFDELQLKEISSNCLKKITLFQPYYDLFQVN